MALIGDNLDFVVAYTSGGVAKTGLVGVTWSLRKFSYATGAVFVASGTATEIGDGCYGATISGENVTTAGTYLCKFSSADTTVDDADLFSSVEVTATFILPDAALQQISQIVNLVSAAPTIFVTPAGNDITGTGSVSAPYATALKGIEAQGYSGTLPSLVIDQTQTPPQGLYVRGYVIVTAAPTTAQIIITTASINGAAPVIGQTVVPVVPADGNETGVISSIADNGDGTWTLMLGTALPNALNPGVDYVAWYDLAKLAALSLDAATGTGVSQVVQTSQTAVQDTVSTATGPLVTETQLSTAASGLATAIATANAVLEKLSFTGAAPNWLVNSQTANQANITVTPIQASVANPRFATRDLAPILAGSAPTDCWTITDSSGNPIDLSAKTLRFVVASLANADRDPFDATFTALYECQSGSGISVSGTASNQVNVTHDSANTATAGRYWYFLVNVTDLLPLSSGQLLIAPVPNGAWT